MPGAARKGDICSGHDCFPPRESIEGSENVFINGIPAHRKGDEWKEHCCGICHTSILSSGSSSVFINGKPAGRIGDEIECGSVVSSGSYNVFIGD